VRALRVTGGPYQKSEALTARKKTGPDERRGIIKEISSSFL